MREVLHLTPADALVTPWKNGRGTTRTLALWPEHADFARGDYEWRVSAAAIVEDGPFSSFPGFERLLLVTSGQGLHVLQGDERRRSRLRRLETLRFSGDEPTRAELVDGPVDDFNVIVRRGAWDATLAGLALGARRWRETFAGGHVLVHAAQGELQVRVSNEEQPFELEPGDTLWVQEARDGEELELAGASAASVALVAHVFSSRAARS